MGKTERILSYLPPTFQPYPDNGRRSLLSQVVSAVGQPLQQAENLLAEVVRAHWVDFADLGENHLRDLHYMAALFDLQPRDDELDDVETFRTHLKSYVRTYLQGSSTVPGVLRLAASTLALSLEDDLGSRPGDLPYVVEVEHPGDDAAQKLFGFQQAEAHGLPPTPARLVGTRDLSNGIALPADNALQLEIDKDNVQVIHIGAGQATAPDLWTVARQINTALAQPIASHNAVNLTLTSHKTFPEAELELGGGAVDALFGIAPRTYTGAADAPASLRGTHDHAPLGGVPLVNLETQHFLRLAINGTAPLEVNCAGADPALSTLDEVCERINTALHATIAAHDGHFLTLTSPTPGPNSRLEIFPAPANDAREVLLGAGVRRINRGSAAAPATLAGRADLHLGLDLPAHSALRLKLDGGAAQDIALTGDHDETLTLDDLKTRINAIVGASIASHDGRFLSLTSATANAASRIEVLTPAAPAMDVTATILGIAPLTYRGQPPTQAMLSGTVVLEEPLDLRLQRRLWLALDGAPAKVIDCAGADPAHTRIQEIVDAINAALGTTVAFNEAGRLVLQSPTAGANSVLVLRAPEQRTRRYFYTQGRVREDAATALFGFASGEAQGTLPEPARLTGMVDLTRGADLRVAHSLRLQVDDGEPLDIRVSDDKRPMVTLLPVIVEKINAAVTQSLGSNTKVYVASEREGKLELTSLVEGTSGRIAFGSSTASDAGQVLFGLPPGSAAQGRAAERVQFVGLADLARGLDVSTLYRLRVGVDARPVTDIDLRTAVPTDAPPILSPNQIANAINQALQSNVATDDGRHVLLNSLTTGSASKVTIELAADHDATTAVFGLSEARSYAGQNATRAKLIGQIALGETLDLSQHRHVSLEIDGQHVADVDCANERTPAQTKLADVVAALNTAAKKIIKHDVVSISEGKLVILSPSSGANSAVVLGQSHAADARVRVMGDAPAITLGKPGEPAVLTATAKLTRPVNLSQRAAIRLQIDGGELREINCAGERPDRTFADEVIAQINAVYPNLASLDVQRRLTLRATARVALHTQRFFTLFEYTPSPTRTPDQLVRQNATFAIKNESVGDEPFEWLLTSLRGVDRPRLTSRDTQAWVQVNAVIPAGYILHVKLDEDDQVHAWAQAEGRVTIALTDKLQAKAGAGSISQRVGEVLRLPVGSSQWQYNDCYGDRFNQAYFGRRSRQPRSLQDCGDDLPVVRRTSDAPLTVVPAHFAGGQVCHSVGVFNVSSFYSEAEGAETVFGSRTSMDAPQAAIAFVYQVHQAGQFELQLPADLPPRFGGRFNEARFAHKDANTPVIYRDAIFDLPEDPQALDEQVKTRPAMVTAEVALNLEEGAPVYDVPFNSDKPLTGGSKTTYARCYLRQPGVIGAVELLASDVGEWGNLIVVAAPESAKPGAFDVSVRYTGQDVFENARPKVAAQLALARAAGVQARVTRR